MPNLETKFVAANTLLDVEKPTQLLLRNPEVDRKEKALEEVAAEALHRPHTPARKNATEIAMQRLGLRLVYCCSRTGFRVRQPKR